jgi:deazaflavin-dependent oxidoreductase (nitroreductase family)
MDMAEYLPPNAKWVADQVELYENSGGTEGVGLQDTGLPCIIVTHTGNKTGGTRKIPLMRVKDGENYVLIGSKGGAPENPVWVYNLRANGAVEIRDRTEVFNMEVREVKDYVEHERLFAIGIEAFPPYAEYRNKTSRRIPVFVAEPI